MNGGSEVERSRSPLSLPLPLPLPSSSFALAMARVAVAQICQGVGFRSAKLSVLDSFSCIATTYMRYLARTARLHAELSGRTECNLLDVVRAIEDLASSHGFTGASDIKSPLAKSGALSEIIEFVAMADEIPFAKRIPSQFDLDEVRCSRSFMQLGKKPPFSHVPSWLPAFPECFNGRKVGKDDEVTPKDLLEHVVSVSKSGTDSGYHRKFLPLERPIVRFEFGNTKKHFDRSQTGGVNGKRRKSCIGLILGRRVKERAD